MKSLKTMLGILFSITSLILFLDPSPTGAQSEYALPFADGPVNISSGPGDGALHSSGPSSQSIDFDLPSGTLIYATKPGVVIAASFGWNDGYGNLVEVRHHDGSISLYGHLSDIFVKVNQPVGRSSELGLSGNSGNVTPVPTPSCPNCGDLLHFEVRTAEGVDGVDVQYLVDWVAGCPGCSDPIKGTSPGAPRESFLLESFLYNSKQRTGASTAILDPGREYLLTVTGTFSFWSPPQWGRWLGDNAEKICWGIAEEGPLYPSSEERTGPVGADPEYQFAIPPYPGGCEDGPLDPRRRVSIHFSTDAGATFQALPPTNDAFSSKHAYQYLMVGNGQPIMLTVLDSQVHDNYGQFRVDIELFK